MYLFRVTLLIFFEFYSFLIFFSKFKMSNLDSFSQGNYKENFMIISLWVNFPYIGEIIPSFINFTIL